MRITLLQGDCLEVLKTLDSASVQCVVTSPPYYGLRDYGVDGQIGLEASPEEYVAKLVAVFREVRRVLKDDGTLWLNMGDSYAGRGGAGGDYDEGGLKEGQPRYEGTARQMRDANKRVGNHSTLSGGQANQLEGAKVTSRGYPELKPKDLIGIPWMLAFALRADGWYLRQDIIWAKPNPMPESVTDRCTKSHEYIFLLSKSARYYYDAEAIAEVASSPVTKLQSHHDPENEKYASVPDERWKDQFDGRIWGDVGTRNRRSVWTVAMKPYKEAHFATYPPDLIEPCILAGTSERGECPKCGKAWVRLVDDQTIKAHDGDTASDYPKETTANRLALLRQAARERGEEYSSHKTTVGWRAQCECGEEPVPQKVLDPFNGSGATGAVALKHRRGYIGIELNLKYLELTRRRLAKVQPRLLV